MEASRSSYYQWKKNINKPYKNKLLEEHIIAIHAVHPYFGYRRIRESLKREGILVNLKKAYRLCKKLDIQSIIRKKRKYFGKKPSFVFENILKRQFKTNIPKHKLVTDITYLPTNNGFYYLSAIQDLYNNEIVSYSVSKQNNLDLVLETLAKLPKTNNAILHSDQGLQYISRTYKHKLEEINIRGSHSRRGNCLDNACIESFFSHLKTELKLNKNIIREENIITTIDNYITFYNTKRFQKKLNQLSPIEYREKLVA